MVTTILVVLVCAAVGLTVWTVADAWGEFRDARAAMADGPLPGCDCEDCDPVDDHYRTTAAALCPDELLGIDEDVAWRELVESYHRPPYTYRNVEE